MGSGRWWYSCFKLLLVGSKSSGSFAFRTSWNRTVTVMICTAVQWPVLKVDRQQLRIRAWLGPKSFQAPAGDWTRVETFLISQTKLQWFRTCFLHENMARDRQGIPKVARSGARSLCLRPAWKGCRGMVKMHGAKRSKTKDGTTYTYIIYILYINIYIIHIIYISRKIR